MAAHWKTWAIPLLLLGFGIGAGIEFSRGLRQPSQAQEKTPLKQDGPSKSKVGKDYNVMMPDSPAAVAADWERAYPQYQPLGKVLQPFPPLRPELTADEKRDLVAFLMCL